MQIVETMCIKCQILFSAKNIINLKLSSAELARSVVKVNSAGKEAMNFLWFLSLRIVLSHSYPLLIKSVRIFVLSFIIFVYSDQQVLST